MKTTELRQLIREEIQSILSEKTFTYVLLNKDNKVVKVTASDETEAGEKIIKQYPQSDPMLTHLDGKPIKWDKGPIRPKK